jgi:TatD DNase family protein
MYIDSHAHFDITLEESPISEDLLIQNLELNEISGAVQVGIDIESSRWSYAFAKRHASGGILFTIGIHPSSRADAGELQKLDGLLSDIKNGNDSGLIFGIGECGLDYYRKRQDRESQMTSFRYQIDLANRNSLPVIVHSRDAMDDTLGILHDDCKTAGIMHCFAGGMDAARRVLDLGFYLSFAGNVTYRSANLLQESARYVPLDRLLLETDAPFLTPVPFRGQKNRPEYVIHTYRFVSELRGEPLAKIIDAVNENFMEICGHALKKI